MAKKKSMYIIQSKQKYLPKDTFYNEKFLTGGESFTFKEAQKIKKKLSRMSSSFLYKVKRRKK
tara:strand:+ start:389 stop:577 length:189 start_codon:yes stop_codon:yes gene_type:complete